MATTEEYMTAANTPPSARTPAQHSLVARGSNMQAVRNADHAATQHEKTHGPSRR